jgi:tetratricopeptide (TPR) repeat protein
MSLCSVIAAALWIGGLFRLPAAQPDTLTGNRDSLISEGIRQFHRAYEIWSDNAFEDAIGLFSRAESLDSSYYLIPYWKAVCGFHCVSFFLFGLPQDTNRKAGETWVLRAIEHLERTLVLKPDYGEAHALIGTLRGIRIYLNPLTALYHGPKVSYHKEQALQTAEGSPRVHYLIGMSYYFTPALLGGGKETAEEYLLTAAKLFRREQESPPPVHQPSWGHSTCLAFVGKLYTDQKKSGLAVEYYRRALEINSKDKIARQGLLTINKEPL